MARVEQRTAQMRESIANQVLNWIDGTEWEDPQRAERIAWKLAEAPERFVSPDPDTGGSHREEASRIYKELKAEYGLRTVREARREARDYDDRRAEHAARAIRENFEAIEAGEADELVDDVVEAYGEEFVETELAIERAERADPGAGELPDVELEDDADDDVVECAIEPEPAEIPLEARSVSFTRTTDDVDERASSVSAVEAIDVAPSPTLATAGILASSAIIVGTFAIGAVLAAFLVATDAVLAIGERLAPFTRWVVATYVDERLVAEPDRTDSADDRQQTLTEL